MGEGEFDLKHLDFLTLELNQDTIREHSLRVREGAPAKPDKAGPGSHSIPGMTGSEYR